MSKRLMVLEWQQESEGGYWMVLGFFENMKQVKAILPTRPKDAKLKVLSVQLEAIV